MTGRRFTAVHAGWITAAGITLSSVTMAGFVTVVGPDWSPWSAAWLVIVGCFAMGFAVTEGLALANRADGDTLSEHVWAVLKVRTGRHPAVPYLVWPLRLVVFWLFAWLALHFTFGWFTPTDPVPW